MIKLNAQHKFVAHPAIFRVLQGLAIDNAADRWKTANPGDFTDNSTGTAGGSPWTIAELTIPTTAFDASAAGGAGATDFNTAEAAFEDVGKVMVNRLNLARNAIGLTAMTAASGTEVTAGTIPAMTKTTTSSSGTSAVDFTTGVASMQAMKDNLGRLIRGTNELLVAVGQAPVSVSETGTELDVALVNVPAGTASADGTSSISKTVADAFFAALADGVAKLAAAFNAVNVPGNTTLNVVNSYYPIVLGV